MCKSLYQQCDSPTCKRINPVTRLVNLCSCTATPICEYCYLEEMSHNDNLVRDGLPRALPQKPFYTFSLAEKESVTV